MKNKKRVKQTVVHQRLLTPKFTILRIFKNESGFKMVLGINHQLRFYKDFSISEKNIRVKQMAMPVTFFERTVIFILTS